MKKIKYIKLSDISRSDHQHPTFTEVRLNAIQQIKGFLDEVSPATVEEWEDDFRRDAHPEAEVKLWLYIGQCYALLAAAFPAGSEKRKEVFDTLVMCSTMRPTDVVKSMVPKSLSSQEFQRVILAYYRGLER